MKIILASQSPRRKELLEKMGITNYNIKASKIEEKMDSNLTTEEQVRKLSFEKANAIFTKTKGNRIVIGADTIVEKNNKIYGKPKNELEAKTMLKELKNSKVNIISGLSVLIQKGNNITENSESIITEIYITDLTDKEIDTWLKTGNAMDKAGAFSIQDEFCIHIEKIIGDYHSAIGLSTHRLYDIIKDYIN